MKCLLLLIMFVIPVGPIPGSFQTKDDPQMESAGAKGAVREVAIKNPSPAVAIREIRGLKDEDWIANLQFEAENKSGRPLYYVSAKLRFPGIVWKETGRNLGFGVSQGDDNFRDLRQKATSDARAITPGETFVLRISEHVAKGLRPFFEERNFTPEQSSNIEFYWDTVNFGEGTGLMSGYLPYPDPAAGPTGFRGTFGFPWGQASDSGEIEFRRSSARLLTIGISCYRRNADTSSEATAFLEVIP